MNLRLDDFQYIPNCLCSNLKRHGLGTSRHLLRSMAWSQDRQKFLGRLGLPEEDVRPWLVAADLLRVAQPDTKELAEQLALTGLVSSLHAFPDLHHWELLDRLSHDTRFHPVLNESQALAAIK